MRDYAYHLARTSGALPGEGILARLWRNWQARRSVARLDRLDDHMLCDIGINRQDIDRALRGSFTEDPSLVLEEITAQRRSEERFLSRRA